MTFTTMKSALLAVLTVIAMSATAPAFADIKDYEFQLVTGEVRKGDGAIVEVRLLNIRTRQPVSDAVISAKRIDMAPDGMEMMAGPIELLPATTPGSYRFRTGLSMQGRWQLSLGAKVQGETGTLESKLVVKVLP